MKIKVAATQMACTWETEENINKATNLIKQAADKGANIILLQELFQTPYFCIQYDEDIFKLAENFENNNFQEAEKSLLKLNSENQSGYFMLSLFALADISLKKGNFQLMEKYYKSIIENKDFDKFYRDLALINLTINSKKIDKNIKLKELQPILTSPSKLQSYAAELEILYLFDVGKVNLAKDKLDKLLKRPDVKNNQKNRLSVIKRVFLN